MGKVAGAGFWFGRDEGDPGLAGRVPRSGGARLYDRGGQGLWLQVWLCWGIVCGIRWYILQWPGRPRVG